MFEAVIFDWDGTLADTRRVIVDSFQEAFRSIGCNVKDESIERLIGIGAENTFREVLTKAGMQSDDVLLKTLLAKKIRAEIKLLDKVNLFDGAIGLLEFLRGRVTLALASMNNREIIDRMTIATRVKKYFSVIITVDEVTRPKPDPEIFLKCAERLNTMPARCVVIEDSVFGVEAAKKVGMRCIGVTTGAYSRSELERFHPDLIVESLTEKERIFAFIFGNPQSP